MNRILSASLGFVVLSLICAGCGSDEEEESGTLASYAAAQCAALQRCSPEKLSYYGGASRCAERYRMAIEGSILPGMNLDATFLKNCSAATKAASCEQLAWGSIEGCDMPPGTLPGGSYCVKDDQCETQYCAANMYGKCGTCEVPAQLGEPCETSASCAKGLWCNYDSSGSRICEQEPDGYQPETPSAPKIGDKCGDYGYTCGSQLRCHNGVCALRVQLGGACSASDDCVAGAWCDYSGDKVCKVMKAVGAGEACDAPGVFCSEGLYCKGAAVCVPFIADGEPCDSYGYDGYPGGCLFPATCAGGVCTLPKPQTCETP